MFKIYIDRYNFYIKKVQVNYIKHISNSFKPIQVKITQDLLTNIFFNCIKAHEDLYDEVSSNSEFLKHNIYMKFVKKELVYFMHYV